MYASLTLQIFSRLYVIENFKYSRWGHYCVIILGRRIRYKFIRHFAFHCQLNLVDTRYIRCILFLQIFVHYQRIIFLLLQSGARCNLEWYFYMATVVLPLLDSIEQASFKRRWREREREKKQRKKKRIVNRRSRVRDLDGISFEDEDPSSSIARRCITRCRNDQLASV